MEKNLYQFTVFKKPVNDHYHSTVEQIIMAQ